MIFSCSSDFRFEEEKKKKKKKTSRRESDKEK